MARENEERLKKNARRDYRLSIPADCEIASKYATVQVKRQDVVFTINAELEAAK